MKACEVLNALGITRSTLYNYYTDGKIRFEKLPNGRLCYNDIDVQSLKGNIRKIWEDKDIQKLKILYSQGLSYREIGKILNRNPEAIHIKVVRLGLRRDYSLTKVIKSKNMSGTNNPMYGTIAWSRGKTKELEPILDIAAKKISNTRKRLFKKGILKGKKGKDNPMYGKTSWRKGQNTVNNTKVMLAGKKCSITKKKIWPTLPDSDRQKILQRLSENLKLILKRRSPTKIEIFVKDILDSRGISYHQNHFLKMNENKFFFDFYIPDFCFVIECQGDYWHANPLRYSEGKLSKVQEKNVKRDNRKKDWLIKNNVPFLFIWEYNITHDPVGTQKIIIEKLIEYGYKG